MNFTSGHKVVHKTHGVGVIQGTEILSLGGKNQDYYILKILSSGLKVRFPKDSHQMIVRSLVTDGEIERIFETLKSPARSYSMVWNRRKKEFMEKIKSGSIFEIAEVYRDLHNRDDGKELSFGEKEMLDKARNRLISEIAAAKSQSGDEVGRYIDELFAANTVVH
ncbi:MAG: CarD family transcriptional regulator [Oligoflexus sp.]